MQLMRRGNYPHICPVVVGKTDESSANCCLPSAKGKTAETFCLLGMSCSQIVVLYGSKLSSILMSGNTSAVRGTRDDTGQFRNVILLLLILLRLCNGETHSTEHDGVKRKRKHRLSETQRRRGSLEQWL